MLFVFAFQGFQLMLCNQLRISGYNGMQFLADPVGGCKCLMSVRLPSLRRYIHDDSSKNLKQRLRGLQIAVRGPSYTRVARERNRFAAILRYAKAVPIKRPLTHPVTQELIPLVRSTCHTCGRQFYYRPRPPTYEPNPNRKYCHPTCQRSRPLKFERWLEGKIMEVLEKTHHVKNGKSLFRCISSDSIVEYVLRHRGNAFRKDVPLHLHERIRQAARRLVAIPGRSGDKWQVVAYERDPSPEFQGRGKWIRLSYAPDRGNIFLSLMKTEDHQQLKTDATTADSGRFKSFEQEGVEHKIEGRVLQDAPEWKGRYYWDEAGKLRLHDGRRRLKHTELTAMRVKGDDLLGTKWAEKQKMNSKGIKFRSAGWTDLLRRNKKVVEALTAQWNKNFGLDQ